MLTCDAYDARRRHARFENDRDYARARIEALLAELNTCRHMPHARIVKVKSEACSMALNGAAVSESPVARALQFLAYHTMPPFARSARILCLHGFQSEPDFGGTPATLKYRQSLQA